MDAQSHNIMDLADIIQSLGTNQRTGTLIVSSSTGNKKYIYFGNGRIEMVSIPRKKYLLGEALYKIGKIDKKTLLSLINKSFQEKTLFGTLLLENGTITEDDLLAAMTFQLQEEISDIFLWQDFQYSFEERDPDPEVFPEELLKSKVSIKTEMLMIEAARRIDEWERIKHTIPSFWDIYRKSDPNADTSQFDESTIMVLENIDGINTVEDVLEKARLDRHSCLQMISYLITQQVITPLSGNEMVHTIIKHPSLDIEKTKNILWQAIELGMDIRDGYLQLAIVCRELGDAQQSSYAYVSYAKLAESQENSEGVIYGYQMAVETDPDNIDAHKQLGESFLAQGRKQDAITAFDNAASFLFEKGDLENSKSFRERILEIDEEHSEARIGMGKYYEMKGDPSQANIEFEQAADLLIMKGRKEDAVNLYRHMLEVDSDCMEAGLSLARTLGDMGKTEEAVKEYQNLASSLSNAGVIGDSIQWGFLSNVYENIVKLDTDNRGAREWLVQSYEEKKEFEKAIGHCEKLAGIYRKNNELEKAEETLQKLTNLKPDDSHVYCALAEVKAEMNANQEAALVLNNAGAYFDQKNDLDTARKMFEKVFTIDSFNIAAHVGLGDILIKEGNIKEAYRSFNTTGKMCRGGRKIKEAIDCFNESLKLMPEYASSLKELSDIYFEECDETKYAEISVRYIEVQRKARNYGEALEYVQKLTALHPKSKEYKQLGELIKKEMKTPSAMEEPESLEDLKLIAKRSPENIPIREKMVELYKNEDDIINAARMLREISLLYTKVGMEDKAAERNKEADRLMQKLGITHTKKVSASKSKKKKSIPEKQPSEKKSNKLFKDLPMSLEDFEKGFK